MIILASTANSLLLQFVFIGITICALGLLLRYLKQPYIIAYIIAGILLGKDGFQIITDQTMVDIMGELGLILLLFFIGMEISLPAFIKQWQVPVIGTFLQIGFSVALVGLIGYFFDWPFPRVLAIGFVISLSSSAVVIKLLQDAGEMNSSIGQHVVSILLMQDILIVPMLVTVNNLGGQSLDTATSLKLGIGGLLLIAVMIWIIKRGELSTPFRHAIERDHELQVFIALFLCLACSALTAWFGFSSALGAFVGGMIVHSFRSTVWFHDSLHSFRIIFVAVFFISIGILIDLSFIQANWLSILLLLFAVYASNHLINAVVLFYLTKAWRISFYGGALLGQVGELSFVLAAAALSGGIIDGHTHQLVVVVIALSLLTSPFWIALSRKLLFDKTEKKM